jgi:hypothetical protein
MLAPEAVRVDVTAADVTPAHAGIPLRPDHYDAIELMDRESGPCGWLVVAGVR